MGVCSSEGDSRDGRYGVGAAAAALVHDGFIVLRSFWEGVRLSLSMALAMVVL